MTPERPGTAAEPRPLDGNDMTQDDFDAFDEAGLEADRDAPQGSNVWTATFLDSLRERGFVVVRATPASGSEG